MEDTVYASIQNPPSSSYPNPFEPIFNTYPAPVPSNSSSTISVSSSTDACRLRGHDQIASDTHAKLGAELVALAAHLKQRPQEVEIYLYETQRITKAIQTLFPSAEIIPHGSFQMQTALPDADLDILIRFPTPESCAPCKACPDEVLSTLSYFLQSNLVASPGSVNSLPSSQYPLLKFISCFANLSVDVAVKITSSWPATEWVNAISYASDWHSCLPALGTFTLIMKLFLRNKGFASVYNGGIGGYALMVYVRSFLKRNPTPIVYPYTKLGASFLTFLVEMSNVKLWQDLGIASDGSLIEKTRLLEICGVEGKSNAFLVWQDPVNPENNTTKGSFRGVDMCKAVKEGLVELLHACSSSSSRPPTPPYGPDLEFIDKTSVHGLLGRILTIPSEMAAHRQRMMRIYAHVVHWRNETALAYQSSGAVLQYQQQSQYQQAQVLRMQPLETGGYYQIASSQPEPMYDNENNGVYERQQFCDPSITYQTASQAQPFAQRQGHHDSQSRPHLRHERQPSDCASSYLPSEASSKNLDWHSQGYRTRYHERRRPPSRSTRYQDHPGGNLHKRSNSVSYQSKDRERYERLDQGREYRTRYREKERERENRADDHYPHLRHHRQESSHAPSEDDQDRISVDANYRQFRPSQINSHDGEKPKPFIRRHHNLSPHYMQEDEEAPPPHRRPSVSVRHDTSATHEASHARRAFGHPRRHFVYNNAYAHSRHDSRTSINDENQDPRQLSLQTQTPHNAPTASTSFIADSATENIVNLPPSHRGYEAWESPRVLHETPAMGTPASCLQPSSGGLMVPDAASTPVQALTPKLKRGKSKDKDKGQNQNQVSASPSPPDPSRTPEVPQAVTTTIKQLATAAPPPISAPQPSGSAISDAAVTASVKFPTATPKKKKKKHRKAAAAAALDAPAGEKVKGNVEEQVARVESPKQPVPSQGGKKKAVLVSSSQANVVGTNSYAAKVVVGN